MGTECFEVSVNQNEKHQIADPTNSTSRTAFSLKRARSDASGDSTTCPPQQIQMDGDCSSGDDVKFTRALRRRPWINYGKFDISSEDDSDCERSFQACYSKPPLPRGVIRGCSRCNDCQKVTARWHPDASCKPVIDEAPVFYPSEEEFKDTLKYIASIRAIAEPHGICRIVPPPSWQPPCPLKDKAKWQSVKFPTRIQQIHKLQVREPMKKKSRNTNGGRRKRRRNSRVGRSWGGSQQSFSGAEGEHLACGEEGRFGFDSGSDFTLEGFEKYADDFKEQYFGIQEMNGNLDSRWEPSVENIEGEYWRMIEKPTEEIEVLYGADVETGIFGSGFPKSSSGTDSQDGDPYVKSGWNLNNFARLPGSVLSYEGGDISGVLVPWLYLGMCFSSFCWHVEDHHFYSLNYMHWGAPKVWYGVPGSAALQLEQAMKKHLPELFEEQPDLLHKLVTQVSPTVLRKEGVPVYRSIQKAGEFVLTFPRAYHAGFNCGFNCAEAVNVAPVDWLPHGQSAVEHYREQCRKTSVSHDKLLLGASREAVRSLWELLIVRKSSLVNTELQRFCGEDGILTKSVKVRVEMERARRVYLANPAKTRKMDHSFDAMKERECLLCYYDLHLSAVGCECCPERFACLEHAKQICKCAWDARFFLYRYDIDELDLLVEALEGKVNAIYRWATLNLGLSLSSYVAYSKTQSGNEPKAASLNVNSQQSKMDINTLLGECKTSFTRMLNMASVSNVGDLISSAVQHHDGKLAGSAPSLGAENDSLREGNKSETSLCSPGNDTVSAWAPHGNGEGMTGSSSLQHDDSITGYTPAKSEEIFDLHREKKNEIPMVCPVRDEIPDMNQPCSFEENDICNNSELTSQKKTISDEESHVQYFSHDLNNKQNIFPPGSKTEDYCSIKTEQLPIQNTKDENTPCHDLLQECTLYFPTHRPISSCQIKNLPFFPSVRTPDNQGKIELEASLRGQGSALANDVEYIVLSDDDGGTEKSFASEKKDEVMSKHLDVGKPKNTHLCGRTTIGNLATEKAAYKTVHNASGALRQASEKNNGSMHRTEHYMFSESANIKECLKEETHTRNFDLMKEKESSGSNWKSPTSMLSPFPESTSAKMGLSNKFQTQQLQGLVHKETDVYPRDHMEVNIADSKAVARNGHTVQQYNCTTPDNTDSNAVSGVDISWNHMTNERKVQSLFVSSSCDSMVNSTKLVQNKGPRVARVVRVQKCSYNVELLDVGVVRSCKSWYNSQTIFPRGFKSRVRFHSILDPTTMCNYLSEVLDAGLVGPLFKVIVEECPTEVFINITVDKCWEMVQERLNQEIRRQRSLGKPNLPALQPPGNLNGLEMFGFTSSSIIQGIEDLDPHHKCIEYWATRSASSKIHYNEKNDTFNEQNKGSLEINNESIPALLKNLIEMNDSQQEVSVANMQQRQLNIQNLIPTDRVHTVLKGLFKRATPDELWTMHKVLSSQYWSSSWKAAFRALVEELQNL